MTKNKNHSFNKSKLPSPSKGVITEKLESDASGHFVKNNESEKKKNI